jgi:LysR family nitrogen assimilation transcriptional regulator
MRRALLPIAARPGLSDAGRESAITTLRQFRYFVKIVELGSMTRAADRLNVAQPALGLQMRQLEQELGVTLLQRHSRGVVPTSAGQLLYERGREILDLVERTTREIAAFGTPAVETVRLGLTPGLMQLVASDLLVRARLLPEVLLRVVEEMSFVLLDALGRGELDLALAYEVPEQTVLRRTPWLRDELVFVTAPGSTCPAGPPPSDAPPPPQGVIGTVALEDALRTELVLADARDPVRRIVATQAERIGIEPRIAFEVQSVQAMKILVGDGLAAGIVAYGSVVPELMAGRLVARRIAPGLTRTLYLVTSQGFDELRGGAALLRLLEPTRALILRLLGPLGRPAD